MYSIIPLKPLSQTKTRLAPILSPQERRQLSRSLLERTISLARQVGEVVVISRSVLVRRIAKEAGAWALVEAGNTLNEAIRQATSWVVTKGGEASLILPSDLPLINLADLKEIIRLGQKNPSIVIAPCHHMSGTNMLFSRPARLIEFAFGPNSFKKHLQAARRVGVEPLIYYSATVALDLDQPEDLEQFKQISSGG